MGAAERMEPAEEAARAGQECGKAAYLLAASARTVSDVASPHADWTNRCQSTHELTVPSSTASAALSVRHWRTP